MMNTNYDDDEDGDAPSSDNAHLLSVNHGADDFDGVHQVAPLVNNQVFSAFKSVEKKISCPEKCKYKDANTKANTNANTNANTKANANANANTNTNTNANTNTNLEVNLSEFAFLAL